MTVEAQCPSSTFSLQYKEFTEIYHFLREKAARATVHHYLVPEILIGGASPNHLVDVGNPHLFYLKILDDIIERYVRRGGHSHHSHKASLAEMDCIYQCFIRNFASLNGEIGTPLKQIAFLPFLQDCLGITVFISLPTGTIGHTNRKGLRGSPFAVKNPFDVDDSFRDPLLSDFSALFQYKALIQACNMCGIVPGSIVPLATLSLDSPLFALFPDLGFWWSAEPEDLIYTQEVHFKQDIESGNRGNVDIEYAPPQISDDLKTRFLRPPAPAAVRTFIHKGQKYHQARLEDGDRTYSVMLANSFPDIVAGNPESYTWSDVATINYTGSVYPSPLGVRDVASYDPSKPAWLLAPLFIAWRACELNEKVFLIDLSANIPADVLRSVQRMTANWRDYAPLVDALNKAICGEISAEDIHKMIDNLPTIEERKPVSKTKNIYFVAEELWNFDTTNPAVDAVVGPLIFCVGAHTHNHELMVGSLRYHLKLLESHRSKRPFWAGVSNHDTMPPLPELSPLLHVMYNLLPNSIPMIFSGVEFHNQMITNKEFGFNTSPELLAFQDSLEENLLGLFCDNPLDWNSLPQYDRHGRPLVDMRELLLRLNRLRRAITDLDLQGYRFVEMFDNGCNDDCFGYLRFVLEREEEGLMVCVNWNSETVFHGKWTYPEAKVVLSVNNPAIEEFMTTGSNLTMQPHSAVILAIGVFYRRHDWK